MLRSEVHSALYRVLSVDFTEYRDKIWAYSDTIVFGNYQIVFSEVTTYRYFLAN